MSIEEAPIRCRFCKDIIEVNKAGERTQKKKGKAGITITKKQGIITAAMRRLIFYQQFL